MRKILKNVDQMFYQDIVEERSGNGCCGYLLCDKECIYNLAQVALSNHGSYLMTYTVWFTLYDSTVWVINHDKAKIFMQVSRHQTKNKCSEFHVITIRFLTLKKEKSFVPMFVFVVPCLFLVSSIFKWSSYILKCIVTFHFL